MAKKGFSRYVTPDSAAREAEVVKTAQLRALRLAKEAAAAEEKKAAADRAEAAARRAKLPPRRKGSRTAPADVLNLADGA